MSSQIGAHPSSSGCCGTDGWVPGGASFGRGGAVSLGKVGTLSFGSGGASSLGKVGASSFGSGGASPSDRGGAVFAVFPASSSDNVPGAPASDAVVTFRFEVPSHVDGSRAGDALRFLLEDGLADLACCLCEPRMPAHVSLKIGLRSLPSQS